MEKNMPINQSGLPSVAIILFCYNQENFIEKSLNSCLNQDYRNLTIIISDDCSTDHTFEKIDKIISNYTGPHKIKLNRNKKNFGIGRHFAFIMDNLVTEELSILCAGDDISKKNRASRIVEEWLLNGKPSLVTHGLIEIDENEQPQKGLRTLEQELRQKDLFQNKMYALHEYMKSHYPIPCLGAVNAYKTSTYKKFGTPQTYCDYEDHIMLFRSLLDDGIHYFEEKLVYYRVHANSHTAQPVKPFYDTKDSLLSQLLNDINLIEEKYINCYQSQKIFVQQWLDYKKAINSYEMQADYQLIEYMWANILFRHNYLIQNKTISEKTRAPEPEYVKPLKTIIFGTDTGAKNLLKKISSGFNCIAACNTLDQKLKDKTLNGIEIINMMELKKISKEIDCIVIGSNNYYQIKEILLNEAGISKNKIIRVPQLKLTGHPIPN